MIMKANKQIGFIYKNNESIDKILKDGDVVFEKGFLREKTSTTLPINFGGVGKDLKDYKIYGNTYQNSTSGKNLISLIPCTSNGITSFYDKETGKMSFSGTPTQQWVVLENKQTVSLPAGTYTLSFKETKSFRIAVRFYTDDANYTQISIAANNKSGSRTFTNDIVALQIWVELIEGTAYDEEFYLQLEEGPVATEYEPYTNGPAPNPTFEEKIISCGDRTKNLFDKNNANIINGYIQGNTGKIISGNSDLIAYIKCKPNTQYSFQRMQIRDNKGRIRIGTTQTIPIADMAVENFYYKGNSEYSTNKLDGYTTGANAEYLLFYFSQISGMSQNEIDTILSSIQIEENSIATSHEPYGYKIPVNVNNVITNIYLDEPLRKIGDYADYIDFVNNKIVRTINEVILNGTENWVLANIYNNISQFDYSNALIKHFTTTDNIALFANYFGTTDRWNNSWTKDNIAFHRVNQNVIRLQSSNFTTLEDFKTWLSTHNTIVDYVLATPTEESITLPNIPTVDGNNTLNIETEITPSQVYIKYKSNE